MFHYFCVFKNLVSFNWTNDLLVVGSNCSREIIKRLKTFRLFWKFTFNILKNFKYLTSWKAIHGWVNSFSRKFFSAFFLSALLDVLNLTSSSSAS